MANFVIDPQSLRELNRKLKSLPPRVARKVIRSAGRKAGNIVRKAVRTEIDAVGLRDTGTLRREIRVKTRSRPTHTDVQVHTGRAFYGMFHEFGTSKHSARPFMRPGFDQSKRKVIREVGGFIGGGVEREARKL